MRTNRGFTLIETIIYIGLFALLIGGAILTTYQILQASDRTGVKATVQDEESFVLRKIDWALGSIDPSQAYTPSSGSSNTLTLTRYDGTLVSIYRSGFSVVIAVNGGTAVPLSTSNVDVTALTFTYIAPTGNGPAGISASFTIKNDTDSQTFTSTTEKYIRK